MCPAFSRTMIYFVVLVVVGPVARKSRRRICWVAHEARDWIVSGRALRLDEPGSS